MLATLKGGTLIGLGGEGDRISSLIVPMLFRPGVSLGNGHGPEKPVIEELDVEEEVFTFAYLEQGGEISDIVNPPVEGIAGSVLCTEAKPMSSISTRDSPNIFSYLSFNSAVKRPIMVAEPEFVSLTRQPEIASSYANLLVYSSYGVSNANVSYIFDEPYKSGNLAREASYYREESLLYEHNVLMPMFSERVQYRAKEDEVAYVSDTTQPKLQIYQGIIPSEINIQSIASQVDGTKYNNELDSNSKSHNDYKSLKLELARHKIISELF